ncbi:beta-beta-alpha zinc fingers domain-containing protein [Dioscorea alata]|uniref:Beta-beta-alpha zinc fingers domain-containing protein n=1 Tax=Dioscorea alata TaxID=55571 RepID=A0ACB7WID1_DIOAL|nr:beta-beta-alpha zinc fingers domain-containing protein [Dioscorea alata]
MIIDHLILHLHQLCELLHQILPKPQANIQQKFGWLLLHLNGTISSLLPGVMFCRVNCDSLEILEQHKNGKQHKKTVQRSEHRQAQEKLKAELLVKNISKPKIVCPWVPEVKTTQVGEANKTLLWCGIRTLPVLAQ